MGLYAIAATTNTTQPIKIIGFSEEAKQTEETPQDVSEKNDWTIGEIKLAINRTAETYGLNEEELYRTIERESNFNPNAIGDDGLSVGIAQYTLPTWLENCSDTDERLNPIKSIDCMGIMFSKQMKHRWTAWRLLYGKK